MAARRLTPADLARGIASLAERFSVAAETANLRALLGRIERCFLKPPASVASAGQAAAA